MIDCLLTESRCFRVSRPASPVGIVVHSTGADNPWLKRYVQPSKTDPDREKLLRILVHPKQKDRRQHSAAGSSGFDIRIGAFAHHQPLAHFALRQREAFSRSDGKESNLLAPKSF